MKRPIYKFSLLNFALILVFLNSACSNNSSVRPNESLLNRQQTEAESLVFDDMLLDPEQAEQLFYTNKKDSEDPSSLGVSSESNGIQFWPKGLIPVVFDESVSLREQKLFLQICKEFGAFSDLICTTQKNIIESRNSFVLVKKDPKLGCGHGYARLGYRGEETRDGVHRMAYGTGNNRCSDRNLRFVLAHELLHILGFLHSQSHPEREDHVLYYPENVDGNKQHNFKLRTSAAGVYDTDYDLNSIMHYSSTSFAKANSRGQRLTTLRPKTEVCASYPAETPSRSLPSSCQIGISYELSELDEESLTLAYGEPSGRTVNERTLDPIREKKSCELNGKVIAHNKAGKFYRVEESKRCSFNWAARKCLDGKLSGFDAYRFTSCKKPSEEKKETQPAKPKEPIENSTHEDRVKALYLEVLERTADPGGVAHYTNLMNSGMNEDQVRQNLMNSDEYKNLQRRKNQKKEQQPSQPKEPVNKVSTEDKVKALYLEVLQRSADPGGLAHYSARMKAGASEDQVKRDMMASEEYKNLKKK